MAVIYYRKSLMDEEELKAIDYHFDTFDNPVGITNQLVIGRYSVLPFYQDQEKSLILQGSKLINTFRQHLYIANFDYYWDIQEYTPKTWFHLNDIPMDEGPFVVKGITNSKKHEWTEMMYAPTRQDAIRIAIDLKKDMYIGAQDIIVRKFEPLVTYGLSATGLPWTNEWRCFFLGTKLLAIGYYWSESPYQGEMTDKGIKFVQNVANIVAHKTNFYTIDIGQKINGDWTVIELNDGQMAGLSLCSPDELYRNLYIETLGM